MSRLVNKTPDTKTSSQRRENYLLTQTLFPASELPKIGGDYIIPTAVNPMAACTALVFLLHQLRLL